MSIRPATSWSACSATGTATWRRSGEGLPPSRASDPGGVCPFLGSRPRSGRGKGTALTQAASEALTITPPGTRRQACLGWKEAALALLILILTYQVVVPFVMIVWTSLKVARPGEADFLSLSITFSNYARAYGGAAFWQTSWNTLSFAFAATLVAFVIGV